MEKLIDVRYTPVAQALEALLEDKSTDSNIIWATDTYEQFGEYFADTAQMVKDVVFDKSGIICPRIQKPQEAQAERTRKKAEVFTPAWLCNKMNNFCDEDWFGRKNVFNTENEDHTWSVTEGKIEFEQEKGWQRYVDSRRLEITCGEAPYLVSRYDVSTGELIFPTMRRIGILDRKLRVVNENTDTYDDWLKWAIRAVEACYGYEYQGDNVLIARINLLLTFAEYHEERWGRLPDKKLLLKTANKIAWNIWQMDGLKDTVPLGKPYAESVQSTLFDMLSASPERDNTKKAVLCKIFNWRSASSLNFTDLKEKWNMGKKLFDYVIGNPPYQEEVENKGDRNNPCYNYFMDASYEISNVVELITPARFLFNAGQTPKSWNNKMLSDEHLSVLCYEPDASKVFPNTEIKGGVAITIHNDNYKYGAIGTFVTDDTMRSIKDKISNRENTSINTIMASQGLYRYTSKFFEDFPDVAQKFGAGTGNKIVSNMLDKVSDVFLIERPQDEEYISLIGRSRNERVVRYIKSEYVQDNSYINSYNVAIPEASGSGAFGEVLGTPILLNPNEGTTDTFINIGNLQDASEAEAIIKYIKTKFSRALNSIKKVTQHNSPNVWQYVPLQDFTEKSDIDWSKSVHEIDLQLYRKYNLDEKEIEFIESHVKEMA